MPSHKDKLDTTDWLRVFPEDKDRTFDPVYTDSGFRYDRYTEPNGRRNTDDSWRYDGE